MLPSELPESADLFLQNAIRERQVSREQQLIESGTAKLTIGICKKMAETIASFIKDGGKVDRLDKESLWSDKETTEAPIFATAISKLHDLRHHLTEEGVDQRSFTTLDALYKATLECLSGLSEEHLAIIESRVQRLFWKQGVLVHEANCRGGPKSYCWCRPSEWIWARESSNHKRYWPAMKLGALSPDSPQLPSDSALLQRNESRIPKHMLDQLNKRRSAVENRVSYLVEFVLSDKCQFYWCTELNTLPLDHPSMKEKAEEMEAIQLENEKETTNLFDEVDVWYNTASQKSEVPIERHMTDSDKTDLDFLLCNAGKFTSPQHSSTRDRPMREKKRSPVMDEDPFSLHEKRKKHRGDCRAADTGTSVDIKEVAKLIELVENLAAKQEELQQENKALVANQDKLQNENELLTNRIEDLASGRVAELKVTRDGFDQLSLCIQSNAESRATFEQQVKDQIASQAETQVRLTADVERLSSSLTTKGQMPELNRGLSKEVDDVRDSTVDNITRRLGTLEAMASSFATPSAVTQSDVRSLKADVLTIKASLEELAKRVETERRGVPVNDSDVPISSNLQPLREELEQQSKALYEMDAVVKSHGSRLVAMEVATLRLAINPEAAHPESANGGAVQPQALTTELRDRLTSMGDRLDTVEAATVDEAGLDTTTTLQKKLDELREYVDQLDNDQSHNVCTLQHRLGTVDVASLQSQIDAMQRDVTRLSTDLKKVNTNCNNLTLDYIARMKGFDQMFNKRLCGVIESLTSVATQLSGSMENDLNGDNSDHTSVMKGSSSDKNSRGGSRS